MCAPLPVTLFNQGNLAAGRITGIADSLAPASNQTLAYDMLDRLTSATQSTTSLGYSYDASGNRTAYRAGTTNYPYTVAAASNKLTALSGPTAQTNVYDLAGNLTGDGSVTYTYNARGRFATAKKGTTTTTYQINGLGQRVKKTVGSTVTLYHYDEGGKLLGEYNSAGTAQYETIYLDDQPVAVIKPGTTATTFKAYYVYADHLNTPRLITDNAVGTANKKVWQWDSDPFGASVPNENPAGAGTFTYNQRFPGQVYDKETGLHYNYFRDYSPATGRYVQSDPIGLQGGINTFGYVGGNPLSLSDPKGLKPVPCNPGLPPGTTCDDGMGNQNVPSKCATAECAAGLTPVPPAQCEDDDCSMPMTLDHRGICDNQPATCAAAMNAAGIQGPYFGQTKKYSKKCLAVFGIGVKASSSAALTIGLSRAATAGVPGAAGVAAVANNPLTFALGLPYAVDALMQHCECKGK
jgi:RHS repeat-associated protein